MKLNITVLYLALFAMSTQLAAAEQVDFLRADRKELSAIILDNSGLDWRTARKVIESWGGRVVHILTPSALIAVIPDGAKWALEHPESSGRDLPKWNGKSVMVIHSPAEAQKLVDIDSESRLSAA